MRVLHIAQSVAGGVGSYLDEIAAYQARSQGPGNVFFLVPEGAEAHLPSATRGQVITFPNSGRSAMGLAKFGISALKAVRRFRPAIVHLHSTFAGAVIRPILMAQRHRPHIVYCPHGWAFGMEVSPVKQRFYAFIERTLVAATDVIIVNSDAERALGGRYGFPASAMRTVKNGIGAEVPVEIEDRGCGKPTLDVAFIGRHDRQKGLDILLDEIRRARCENIQFHVVGKPIIDRNPRVSDWRPSNVTFYGWLSRAEIFKLLTGMDAVVIPSRWEAFGLVAIEAMRCGVPVIASNRGALPEIIRHGIDGLIVDIGRSGELGRVLAGLDRVQLRLFGKAAQTRFRAEFTAERMNRMIEGIYESVVGDAPMSQTLAATSLPPRSAGSAQA